MVHGRINSIKVADSPDPQVRIELIDLGVVGNPWVGLLREVLLSWPMTLRAALLGAVAAIVGAVALIVATHSAGLPGLADLLYLTAWRKGM